MHECVWCWNLNTCSVKYLIHSCFIQLPMWTLYGVREVRGWLTTQGHPHISVNPIDLQFICTMYPFYSINACATKWTALPQQYITLHANELTNSTNENWIHWRCDSQTQSMSCITISIAILTKIPQLIYNLLFEVYFSGSHVNVISFQKHRPSLSTQLCL